MGGLRPSKRARIDGNENEFSTSAQDAAHYEQLQLIPLPEEILSLPHVLKLVDTFVMSPGEALHEATRTCQTQWVDELLDRFHCVLPDILVQTSGDGHIDVVQLLLNQILHLDSENLEDEIDNDTKNSVKNAAIVAAKNGHLKVVKLLLRFVVQLEQFSFTPNYFITARNVLDTTASNGHLEVVKFMMEHARENRYQCRYSIWPKVDTLSLAIRGDHGDVAEYLIKDSGVDWNLESAFVRALEKNQVSILETIYDNYQKSFPTMNLFVVLARSGHLDAVKYLHNHKCNDAGLVGKALAGAAECGKIEVVKFLVATDRVSSEAFDKAFKKACSGFNNVEVVTFLYNLKRVSTDIINSAFAVTNGVEVIKLLYDIEKISESAVISAFKRAMSYNYIGQDKIIQFLYKDPCIPTEMIDEAFLNAATAKIPDIIECLRVDARLSSKAMGAVFVDTVKQQDVNLVKSWFDKLCIPPDALVRGFTEAAHRQNIDIVKEIVKYLSVEESVPVETLHQTFIAAAHHGQMSILQMVYQILPADLPLNVLKDALDMAGGNGKIENFIRKLVCDQVFKDLRAH